MIKSLKLKIKNCKRVRAFTLLELLIVIGITTVLSGVGVSYYASQRRTNLLDATARDITGYLRYVQRKSIAQQEGKQWGVHFENPSSGKDFYALYTGTSYSTPIETHYLPAGIEFQKPTSGNSIDISFAKLTGADAAGTDQSITIESVGAGSTSTISVSSEGLITY